MIAYRLTRRKYARDLTGAGGLKARGRCNRKGTPVLYAAQHPALALTEVLAHLPLDNIPLDYVLVTIETPDTVPVQRATPRQALAVSLSPPAPVFLVPSVLVPQEFNVIRYPHARGFEANIVKIELFRIDPRLLRIR